MRRFYGDSDALDTINAAASAFASAEHRLPQPSAQKRRWTSFWCFGFHRHRKRIGHAVLVSESSASGNDSSAAERPTQPPPPITLPFVAPPSSPASFFQSEPPSALQSPVGVMSLTSISANMYSPSGPSSIFAIGPYAHETQLVSPPVFSTFTTEPSTAPFTPPPESVHLTTPSSPEVPFAQLLDPSLRNCGTGLQFPFSNYEFHSYQLYPGSPVGQLISPSSGVSGSGTSSPFPDGEFAVTGPRFPEFHIPDAPKLLNLDNKAWGSGQVSGTLTPDSARPTSSKFPVDSQFSDVASHSNLVNGKTNVLIPSQRDSFDLITEKSSSCLGSKPESPVTVIPANSASEKIATTEPNSNETEHNCDCRVGETSNETPEKASTEEKNTPRHQKHRSLTLGSLKEFNFDSTNEGDPQKSNHHGPDWWANGTDNGKEDGACKNWSFPVIQPDADWQQIS
ncbi:hydroxyproline-rich glycoprotein family protein [Euphorbia peplus]|nr:hydroxyproline-rich glycoprotein family protein [Euphorbia peplus]